MKRFEKIYWIFNALCIIKLGSKKVSPTKKKASKTNGSILAKSFERSSLRYAVILTAPTNEAEIVKIVVILGDFDKMIKKIDKNANHIKLNKGKRRIYSTKYKTLASNL